MRVDCAEEVLLTLPLCGGTAVRTDVADVDVNVEIVGKTLGDRRGDVSSKVSTLSFDVIESIESMVSIESTLSLSATRVSGGVGLVVDACDVGGGVSSVPVESEWLS